MLVSAKVNLEHFFRGGVVPRAPIIDKFDMFIRGNAIALLIVKAIRLQWFFFFRGTSYERMIV